LVVGTPTRVQQFVEADVLNLKEVSYLALDEADQMLDAGFGPQVCAGSRVRVWWMYVVVDIEMMVVVVMVVVVVAVAVVVMMIGGGGGGGGDDDWWWWRVRDAPSPQIQAVVAGLRADRQGCMQSFSQGRGHSNPGVQFSR